MLKRNGFTIMEIMIVVAIIGIIVGIALPRFKGMQDEGNVARAKGDIRTLQTAVESYYVHYGSAYPSALSNLTSATPNIVSSLPADPFNSGSNYGYAASSSGRYYVLYSSGPGTNGSAAIADTGNVTETNGASCIYVTNGNSRDAQP